MSKSKSYTSEELNRVSSSLMSAREHSVASFFLPYRYEIKTLRGKLEYFGTRHFRSVEDHQFQTLCDAVRNLKPSIILVEHEQALHRNARSDIRENFIAHISSLGLQGSVALSESGLAAALALEIGAKVECPEPSDEERFRFLHSRGFTAQQVASYYLVRAASMAALWRDTMTISEVLDFRIGQLLRSWPWEPASLTQSSVEEYLMAHFEISLKETDTERFASLVAPTKVETQHDYSVLNAIGASVANFTDSHIVLRLVELSREHNDIFVVFGASHALREEAILRELLRLDV